VLWWSPQVAGTSFQGEHVNREQYANDNEDNAHERTQRRRRLALSDSHLCHMREVTLTRIVPNYSAFSKAESFDLISDALPFGRLWYTEPNAVSNAISYARFRSRSHNAVIRVYDEAGNVIETHEHTGDFKEW
jgi:hypothetical protein